MEDIKEVVKEGESFLKRKLERSHSSLKLGPHKEEDSVSITMPPDTDDDRLSGHVSSSVPDAKTSQGHSPGLYPSLKIFHSEARHNNDPLSPEEEAELEKEAAKNHNPDWPPLTTGQPLSPRPPPYQLQMPAFTQASAPHYSCFERQLPTRRSPLPKRTHYTDSKT